MILICIVNWLICNVLYFDECLLFLDFCFFFFFLALLSESFFAVDNSMISDYDLDLSTISTSTAIQTPIQRKQQNKQKNTSNKQKQQEQDEQEVKQRKGQNYRQIILSTLL